MKPPTFGLILIFHTCLEILHDFPVYCTSKRNGPVTTSNMVKPCAVPDLGGDRRKLTLYRDFMYVYAVL